MFEQPVMWNLFENVNSLFYMRVILFEIFFILYISFVVLLSNWFFYVNKAIYWRKKIVIYHTIPYFTIGKNLQVPKWKCSLNCCPKTVIRFQLLCFRKKNCFKVAYGYISYETQWFFLNASESISEIHKTSYSTKTFASSWYLEHKYNEAFWSSFMGLYCRLAEVCIHW